MWVGTEQYTSCRWHVISRSSASDPVASVPAVRGYDDTHFEIEKYRAQAKAQSIARIHGQF